MSGTNPPLPRSERYVSARQSLPAALRAVFDQLAVDYRNAAQARYGRPFVSYEVLADLIFEGWRKPVAI